MAWVGTKLGLCFEPTIEYELLGGLPVIFVSKNLDAHKHKRSLVFHTKRNTEMKDAPC